MSELPDGWSWRALRDLTLPITKVVPIETGRETIRYIDIGSIDGARHALTDVQEIAADGAPSRARQVVAAGDTVFSTVRPYLEKIAYVDHSLDREFASTGFSVLRPSPDLVPKYLFYFSISRAMLDQVLPLQKGVSYPAVLDKEIRSIVVPVPPLFEQHRIVEILEKNFSRLDMGVASLNASAVRLDRITDASISVAPELLSAPTKTLGQILAVPLCNGKSVPTADEGFPVLRLTAIRDGVIDLNERKIGKWTAEHAVSFRVSEGDVFASRGNGSLKLVGRAARVIDAPDPVAYPDTMIRMKPDSNMVRADYLTTVWNSRLVRRQIEARARTTAGIYKVNQTDVRGIMLPVPSLSQQGAVIERINDLSYTVRAAKQSVRAAKDRADALRHSLLTAAFSGSLTGSASEIERMERMAGV